MQWIRFDARLEAKVLQAYLEWKERLPTHDPKEPDEREIVEGPKTGGAGVRLVDRRFIDYLDEISVPFERP